MPIPLWMCALGLLWLALDAPEAPRTKRPRYTMTPVREPDRLQSAG